MRTIDAVGGLLLVLILIVLVAFTAAAVLLGINWVTLHLYPWVYRGAELALGVDLLLLIPLAIFRATRSAAAEGFIFSGLVYGLAAWVLAFLTAYQFWGVSGVVIGICFAGIGVIPVAVLAAFFHSAWDVLGNLAIGILLWVVSIWFGSFLAARSSSNKPFIGP